MSIALIEDYADYPEKERWIREFIDFEILDPVWFQILRNHPELQVDSNGKQISLPRNHNLRNTLNAKRHGEIENYHSGLIALDEQILTGISSQGKFCAYHGKSLKLLKEVNIRSSLVPPPGTIPPAAAATMKAGSYLLIKEQLRTDIDQILLNYSVQVASNLSQDQLSEIILWKARVVMIGLDVFLENLDAAAATTGGKKPPPKKDAPPIDLKPKKFYKYRVIVFDIYANITNTTANANNTTPFVKFERIHDFYLETIQIENPNNNQDYLNAEEIQDLLANAVITDLSPDGRLLQILIHENQYTSCLAQLYDLSKPKEYIVMNLTQLLSQLPVVEEENDDHSIASSNYPKVSRFSPRGGGGDKSGPSTAQFEDDTNNDPVLAKNPFLITQTRINGPATNATEKKLILKKSFIIQPLEIKYDYFQSKAASSTANTDNTSTATNTGTTGGALTASTTDPANTTNIIMIDENRLKYYSKLQFIFIPNDFPFLLFYTISALKPDFTLITFYGGSNVGNVKDAKGKDAAKKGKEKEDTNQSIVNFPYSLVESNRWYFTSPLTAWASIEGVIQDPISRYRKNYREYLLLGQMDGVITMWDIYKQNLIGQLGIHPSPITSLSYWRSADSLSGSFVQKESIIVVSAGSLDGTVTIYSNKAKIAEGSSKPLVTVQVAAPAGGTSTKTSRRGTPERGTRGKDTGIASAKSLNSISAAVANQNKDVRKGIAISDFQLIDYRHDGFHDTIVNISIQYDPSQSNAALLEEAENDAEKARLSSAGKELHIILIQYLSGTIGVYILQDYETFFLIYSINRQERIQYENIPTIFLNGLHLPLSEYRFPDPVPPVDPNAPPTAAAAVPPVADSTLTVPTEEGLDDIKESLPVIEDIFTNEKLPLLYEKYTNWMKKTGKSFSSFVYIQSSLPNTSYFYLHTSRQLIPSISKYSIKFTPQTIRMETNYNVAYLDINAIAEMRNSSTSATTGKVSKLKERMPSSSSGLGGGGSKMSPSGRSNSPTTIPYKTLKLTEEILLEHEKLFQKTSNHSTDLSSKYASRKNSQNLLQMELNNSLLPVDLVKAELWQSKKIRNNSKGKLAKKLTTLANLCA